MPGNEVGDRIRNFLGQESFSHGQLQSQVIDSSWPGLSNNLWVRSQGQVGGPLVSSLKNLNAHQLESDRGHSSQSSRLQHEVNFTQSDLRPENFRSQLQNQSAIANGYKQGHESFQARQNETNVLGLDAAPTGSSSLDSPIGNGPDFPRNGSLRLESTESPINYDLIGRQQQFSGKDPSMIQPLPRQQSGMTDMQLLQQHAIMQELQRHLLPKPQFQFPEARQLSSANQVSSVKEESDSLSSAPIDGAPVRDASSYSWQPERMTQNANCMQHGASPAMGGSSGMFSPGKGQMCLMGMVPQQVDESFYGISTSGARGNAYQYSSVQMDKPLMQQVPAGSHSFLDNQYMFSDQVGLQDGTSVSRQCEQDNNVFGDVAGQGLNSEFHSENLQQMVIQPKTVVMLESPQMQAHCSPPETPLKKSAIQVPLSQTVATLDPIEEKILFGSDDNMWDILGKSTNMGSELDGTGSLRGFPSLQSGIWSTLMMSAVTETSSNDIGVQEQWSGSDLQNCEPPSGNMPASTVNDGTKKQSAWVDNNFPNASLLNSKPLSMSNTHKLVLPENNASQNSANMQRDIEGFGYYSRPNNVVHEEQAMNDIEGDPSNRSVKRFKGPSSDSSLESQQVCSQDAEQLSYGSNALMRDAQDNHPLAPSGDSKVPSSLPNAGDNCETQLSANMLAFVQNDSKHFSNSDNSAANIRSDNAQISPQMAPSWFDRYGAIKNGKMLPVYDTQKVDMMNATEKAFIVGQASNSLHVHTSEHDAGPLDKVRQSSNFMPTETEYISPHSLPPDIASQNLVAARAMKRKIMTLEFLPWHREVTQGSQRPQNISAAEVEWTHAANRLIEKLKDEPEMIKDWPPVLRSKRRLVLTTQLLQQLLRAPPRVVLSADARKNYDTLAYFVARSVLGDTCSMAYITESDTAFPPRSGSILSEKQREQRNQSILKTAEGFIDRAKMLENSLRSLVKRASLSDLRLECQDQEKVSVITRLAKFHSRGQANGAHKFFGQRYVIALPMPGNLPDRVQCLTL